MGRFLPRLLWLMLLLPLAQSAALWHSASHAGLVAVADAGQPDDPSRAPHAGHCALCLLGHHVLGHALPTQAAAAAPFAAQDFWAQPEAGAGHGSPSPPFQGRGPPGAGR